MNPENEEKNLKGTWAQALGTFLLPIFLVLGFRWALFEPFVIPSGSMIPNLLIHDHILVKKFAFGLHVPFSDQWLVQWKHPERGDIIVFKYPENPEVFFIKRLIGLPGDEVRVRKGRISVNGQAWELTSSSEKSFSPSMQDENDFVYFNEKIPSFLGKENDGKGSEHLVRYLTVSFSSDNDRDTGASANTNTANDAGTITGANVGRLQSNDQQIYKVPAGMYFFMGDNRDQSSDSRVWGFVKDEYIVGKASVIWLSCESMLPTMTFVCDPAQIRWGRLFQKLY